MATNKPASKELASKKPPASPAPPRGEALIRAAIAAAVKSGRIPRPAPVPAELLARLRLPNEEPLSPALAALLAFDASWLGAGIDAEDAAFEALDLEDLIAQEYGEDAVPLFEEVYELLSDDCILLGDDGESSRRFLYVGNPDSAGEYPVITVDVGDVPWIGGFVPFDVWVAQQLGALAAEEPRGWVPEAYAACPEELARRNGDGRTSFAPGSSDA